MISHSIALFIIIFCGFILGYLSGSILWSVIIGKRFFKKDPRDFNSKNAGATNSSRLFGKRIGLIILILDILKCYIPILIMWLITKFLLKNNIYESNEFNEMSLLYLTSFGALLGHCYPVFFKFKGGKAVSAYISLLLAISPWISIVFVIVWMIIVLITKYVSLASMISSLITIIFIFIPGLNWTYMLNINIKTLILINNFNLYSILLIAGICLISSIILIVRHKANIQRLIKHIENRAF